MARSSMCVLALLSVASFPLSACTSPAPGPQRSASITLPALGTAETFAVVGGQAVTNTGPTTVLGNLGVSPGLAVTGFPPGMVTGGVIHAGDSVALQAKADITTAYNRVAGLDYWTRPIRRTDLHAGYAFDNGVMLDLSVSNLFEDYSYWAHVGRNSLTLSDVVNSGRTTLLTLKYDF